MNTIIVALSWQWGMKERTPAKGEQGDLKILCCGLLWPQPYPCAAWAPLSSCTQGRTEGAFLWYPKPPLLCRQPQASPPLGREAGWAVPGARRGTVSASQGLSAPWAACVLVHQTTGPSRTEALAFTQPSVHSLVHSLVYCMNSCLCQALCWLPVWAPGLVRGQSQARTGWYSAGPAGTEWYSRRPVPGRGWGGSGLRCRRVGASARLPQALSPYL